MAIEEQSPLISAPTVFVACMWGLWDWYTASLPVASFLALCTWCLWLWYDANSRLPPGPWFNPFGNVYGKTGTTMHTSEAQHFCRNKSQECQYCLINTVDGVLHRTL